MSELEYRLGDIESKFADILWENSPISSKEMIALAEQELGWKRPTTYTVLRKFIARGMFENTGANIEALITKEEFYARKSCEFVEKSFEGSLPKFLVAFGSKKKLSKDEIDELKRFIEENEEE